MLLKTFLILVAEMYSYIYVEKLSARVCYQTMIGFLKLRNNLML